MPKSLDSLLSFSSGIWSPKLDARVDQQKYKSAMRESLNVIPYKQGGFTRRPGLQYAGAGKYANTTGHDYSIRLKKFTFSPTTSFMLEFGDEYIRFYSASRQQLFLNLSDVDGWVSTQAYVPGDFVKSASVIYYNILGVSAQIPPATNPNPLIDPTHWTVSLVFVVVTMDRVAVTRAYVGDPPVSSVFRVVSPTTAVCTPVPQPTKSPVVCTVSSIFVVSHPRPALVNTVAREISQSMEFQGDWLARWPWDNGDASAIPTPKKIRAKIMDSQLRRILIACMLRSFLGYGRRFIGFDGCGGGRRAR